MDQPSNPGADQARTHEIISAIIHPQLHTSILVLYVLLPNNTSGALYQSVTTSFENVFTGIPNALAKPKSASLSSPRLLMRRFWGLRSRWRTRLRWQKEVPRRSWYMKERTVSGGRAQRVPWTVESQDGMISIEDRAHKKRHNSLSMYFFKSWSMNSNTSINLLSV